MWLLLVLLLVAVAAVSATKSPWALTVSRRPLTQKLHLADGLQSMGSGGGDGVLVAPGVGVRDESCDVWLFSKERESKEYLVIFRGLYRYHITHQNLLPAAGCRCGAALDGGSLLNDCKFILLNFRWS